ncbi:hypothetical protein ACFL6S_23040, partial [Candidatus Poribacteria bacterium]
MKTIHWLIISILLFDVGYYIGRWVGRSQGRGKALEPDYLEVRRKAQVTTGIIHRKWLFVESWL